MAGNQAVGGGSPAEFSMMSKSQIYDVMSNMKTFLEKEPEHARQLLIQNPQLTKALFQSQIILGMVQPPQQVPTTQPTPSQAPPLPVQDRVNSSQPPIKQQNAHLIPSTSSAPVSLPPQSLPPDASQSLQPPMENVQSQATAQSRAESSQLFNVPTTQPPALQPPMASGSSQLQTIDIQHPPPQPRLPSMPPFSNQLHSQMGPPPPNMGFQYSGVPHLHHSQPMFYPGNRPSSSGGTSFQQGQPPHQSMYQMRGIRPGPEFNSQAGNSIQPERGPARIPGIQDNAQGIQLPGPPAGQMGQGPGQIGQLPPPRPAGQMGQGPAQIGQGIQPPPPRPAGQMGQGPGGQAPRSPQWNPDMEKALLEQVMSLTPEQINHLPPEQRSQVLQLQQALRH